MNIRHGWMRGGDARRTPENGPSHKSNGFILDAARVMTKRIGGGKASHLDAVPRLLYNSMLPFVKGFFWRGSFAGLFALEPA